METAGNKNLSGVSNVDKSHVRNVNYHIILYIFKMQPIPIDYNL